MITLVLPRLVAGGDLARAMVDKLANIEGTDVYVDCRETVDGTHSFASQLVKHVLLERHANSLTLVAAPTRFAMFAAESAASYGVAEHFDTSEAMPKQPIGA